MAGIRQDSLKDLKTTSRTETSEEREHRLKMLRDKQNEERQRKLEELKAQALAAQQFREKTELERRRRIEELRVKENDRRQLVGERKRLINEAERDRRESILKKNQEREIRYEMKKRNERGSIAFAFGSSTPRMLEPADTGGSFWGYRRATSTSNILFSVMPLTRRSSERELDGNCKKRATSAGGVERNNIQTPEEVIPAGCASGYMGRRRTDLMPTIPVRDSSSSSITRKPFTKSPGRTYSMSRLDQLAQPRKPRIITDLNSVSEHTPHINNKSSFHSNPASNKSMSRSMSNLTVTKRLNKSDSRSMHHLSIAPPIPRPRTTTTAKNRIATPDSNVTSNEGTSRPGSSLSQQSTSSVSSTVNLRTRSATGTRKPRPASIAITGITHDTNKNAIVSNEFIKKSEKPPLPKTRKPSIEKLSVYKQVAKKDTPTKPTQKISPKKTTAQSPSTETPNLLDNHTIVQSKSDNILDENKQDYKENIPSAEEQIIKTYNEAASTEHHELLNITSEDDKKSEETKKSKEIKKSEDINKPEKTKANEEIQKIEEIKKSVENKTTEEIKKSEDNKTTEEVKIVDEIKKSDISKSENTSKISDKSKTEEISTQNNNNEKLDKTDSTDQQNESMENTDMTASMIAKIRITTEEEAKAALAEKRRLVREEAERQALAEKLRIQQEEERQRQEEEQLRLLAEEQRKAEEERLAQAIREAQQREEEERLRKQEELKQKLEKEELEKRMKEENEKKKAEMEERLKLEGTEREARRKRVEAIMLRTRGKGSPGSQNKDSDINEKNNTENENKPDIINNKALIGMFDKSSSEDKDGLLNGSIKNQWPIISHQNGESHKDSDSSNNEHQNGTNTDRRDNQSFIEHNVTNTLLDLNEFDAYRNTNSSLDITDRITMEDNVNSNNSTESDVTRDVLL